MFYNFKNKLQARQINETYTWTAFAQARVWQPIPTTIPALPNTCFFAYPDSAI